MGNGEEKTEEDSTQRAQRTQRRRGEERRGDAPTKGRPGERRVELKPPLAIYDQ